VNHSDADEGPIESYLDQLVGELSTQRPRELRRLLAEAEAHLRDDAALAETGGASRAEAEQLAVDRFGSSRDLVSAEDGRHRMPLLAVFRQCLVSGLLLGGLGGLAVGVSGLIAAVIRGVAGSRALVDVVPGTVLSAQDCNRWHALDPAAQTCREAAVADWANETVFYRLALGIVGGVCLLAYFWLRRRTSAPRHRDILPTTVINTLAVSFFGAAAAWTLVLGLDAVRISSGHGAGQWLSATPVALAAAAVFGVRLLGELRERAG
jgi:hypothetical protein